MGTQYKSAMLQEQTMQAIRQWHAGVKDKRKKASPRDDSSTDQSSHHRTLSFAEYVEFNNKETKETKENYGEVCEANSSIALSSEEVQIEISNTS